MARKDDRKLSMIKAELRCWIEDFRKAQKDLNKLRGIGANETDIQHVMNLMGFGAVTPDEFLLASTAEEIGRVVLKLRRLEHSLSAD